MVAFISQCNVSGKISFLKQCFETLRVMDQGSYESFTGENVACSRLSVSGDDQKRERATSVISNERDPAGRERTPLVARRFFDRPH